MRIDDSNFIDQIKKKNSKALEFIVNTYGNLVYKVAYSVLYRGNDISCIEECVNDVFLCLWNNIDSFDQSKGNFKNWLIAVTKYKAIDYKRKICRQANPECIDDYSLADDENTEKIIIEKENREELLALINSMDPVDREIFIRRYFLDEEISNIADKLSIRRSAVDNRLSRGRKSLKKKFSALKGELFNEC